MAFGTRTSVYEMDGVGAAPAVNNAADQIARLKGVAQSNSAFNAEQAELQRGWSESQSAKAMQFNASEAAKNRDWQKMMSDTAHQREVRDLMAAGLNPVLSAMNGNGASVGSGATASGVVGSGSKADADTSTSGAIANLLGSILSAQTALQSANINARTQEAVADKYTAMENIVAQINAELIKKVIILRSSEELRKGVAELGTSLNRKLHKNLLGICNTLQSFGIGLRHFSNVSIDALHLGKNINFTILITAENRMNIRTLSKALNILINILGAVLGQLNLATLIVATSKKLLKRGTGTSVNTLTSVILRVKLHRHNPP
jgi:hypothetical protein